MPALLLLLYPADKLLSSRTQLRSFDSFRNLQNSPGDRGWWRVPLLWLDPVRGLAGTILLKRALGIVPADWVVVREPPYWLAVGVLAVAVAAQTITRRERGVVLAPMGFVSGVVAALLPPAVVLIGLAMATAALFAFRRFHAFFTVGAAIITLLGLLLHTRMAWLVPSATLVAVPGALGFLTGSQMELPARRDAGPSQPPFPPR